MRTTVTLDNDVAANLKAEIRTSGMSFKQIVNDCLRAGLDTGRRNSKKSRPFKVQTRSLEPRLNVDDYPCVWQLVEQLDGPMWR
jgi:hypothetical protein